MPNPRYGYVIATNEDGRVVWSSINNNNILPSQVGKSGQVLNTDGSRVSWSSNLPYLNINNLNIGSGNTGAVGRLSWNPDDGTLDLGLLGGNSTLQIGQELIVRAFNNGVSQINDGEVVSIDGAQGQRISIVKAIASGPYSASHALGVATENIPAGQAGFVTVFGTVRNLNTYIDGLSEGDEIFLSPTTPGAWTTVRPSAPNHAISLGFIQREHSNSGSLFIRLQNGDHLEYLHDVLITSPASGQALIYDSSSGLWRNSNITGGGSGINYTAGSGLSLTGTQFSLGGTGNIRQIRFLSSNNTNFISFSSPALSSNTNYILPPTDGASGQFLRTDGINNLAWTTPVPTSGTATALNTSAVSNNATFYPVLSSGAGGAFAASVDMGLTYNPSTDMLTASGVTMGRVVGNQNIIITESTTARTLQAADNGGIIRCTNTSGATLTLPTGLPIGFSVGVLAAATGVVSFATSGGAVLNNRQSHTRLAGRWAMGTVLQDTTNNFVLAGDTV